MKTYKLLVTFCLGIIAFVACEKEANLITSFDFTIEESHTKTTTINYLEKTSFKIIPTREISTTVFNFKYVVVEGEGKYFDEEEKIIPENQFIEVSSLDFNLYYKSNKKGKNKIEIEINDNQGLTEKLDLEYTISDNDFEVKSSYTNELKQNEESPIIITLNNIGVDKSVIYERAYYIIQGEGKLYKSNEEEIKLEEYNTIETGNTNIKSVFSKLGKSKIVVATRDNNNQSRKDTLSFNVRDSNFSFTDVSLGSNILIKNQTTDININIEQDASSQVKYEATFVYESSSKEAFIKNKNNTVVSENVFYNINTGETTWSLLGNNEGQINFRIKIKDSNGNEYVSEILTIDVYDYSINVSHPNNDSPIYTESTTPIFVDLQQTGTNTTNYQAAIVYESSSISGIFKKGTITIAENEFVPVIIGRNEFTLISTPNNIGAINFRVKVKDFAGNEKLSEIHTVNVYNFNITSGSANPTTILEDDFSTISFTNKQEGTGLVNYESTFVYENGSTVGTFKKGNTIISENSYIPSINGNNDWSFQGINVGTIRFRIKTRSGSGQTKFSNVIEIKTNQREVLTVNNWGAFIYGTTPITNNEHSFEINRLNKVLFLRNVIVNNNSNNDIFISYKLISKSNPNIPFSKAKARVNGVNGDTGPELPLNPNGTKMKMIKGIPYFIEVTSCNRTADCNGNDQLGYEIVEFTIESGSEKFTRQYRINFITPQN